MEGVGVREWELDPEEEAEERLKGRRRDKLRGLGHEGGF